MRPMPPADICQPGLERFMPADDLRDWIEDTFIAEDAPLANQDHFHLAHAELGVLWTNAPNGKHMRTIIGQAEIMPPMAMGKWPRARAMQQIEEWFGTVPDFLITFFAPVAAAMDDVSFCALVEHELYHCGQEKDQYGAPKFNRETGEPKFAIRGHDVEEFTGVVARYGPSIDVAEMVEAANAKPLIGRATVEGVCGTCMRRAA